MELNRDTINKIRGLILFTVITVIVGINYIKVLGLLAAAVNMAAPFILGAAIAFCTKCTYAQDREQLKPRAEKGQPSAAPCEYGTVHPPGGRCAVSCYVW